MTTTSRKDVHTDNAQVSETDDKLILFIKMEVGKEEEAVRVRFNCSFDFHKTMGSCDVFRTGVKKKMAF